MNKETDKWQIIDELENLYSDVNFEFEFQKAMLLSLLDKKIINQNQYISAETILKNKKIRTKKGTRGI